VQLDAPAYDAGGSLTTSISPFGKAGRRTRRRMPPAEITPDLRVRRYLLFNPEELQFDPNQLVG